MKDNILFTVTNEDIIPLIKGLGIEKFVYPLSFFCVGIPKTFKINEIHENNAYLLINRVLDCKSIDDLKIILKNLPNNIKGIIFDDLGIISVIKDLPIEKILYNSHFAGNYESVNYLLDYVDSVILSCDISESEIDEIINKSKKKISLFTFGLVPSLYSRRELIKNYSKHYDTQYDNIKNLTSNNKKFIAIENEFGTMMYHYPYFNGTRLLKKDAKYYFYFPLLLDNDKIINVLNNDFSFVENDSNFLDIKTIYKIRKD